MNFKRLSERRIFIDQEVWEKLPIHKNRVRMPEGPLKHFFFLKLVADVIIEVIRKEQMFLYLTAYLGVNGKKVLKKRRKRTVSNTSRTVRRILRLLKMKFVLQL